MGKKTTGRKRGRNTSNVNEVVGDHLHISHNRAHVDIPPLETHVHIGDRVPSNVHIGDRVPSNGEAPVVAACENMQERVGDVDPDRAPIARTADVSQQTAHASQEGSVDQSRVIDTRVLIEPEGDGFLGAFNTSSIITDIFQSHYNGAFTQLKEVPIIVRNAWFEEFGKYFRWQTIHDSQIKINWEKQCKRRLSNMLKNSRVKQDTEGISPHWIPRQHWDVMREYYKSDKLSEAAKKNRGKLKGSSHTGGSISFTEHERRERKEEGDKFNRANFFKKRHTFQKGENKGKFVNERAKKIMEEVESMMNQYSQSSDSVDMPPIENMITQAAGGPKKGRICGLGSIGVALIKKSKISNSTEIIDVENKMSEMKKDMQEKMESKMKSKMAKMKNKFSMIMEDTYEQFSSRINVLYNTVGVPPPPPIHVDIGAILNIDDDDDDDSSNGEGDTFSPVDHHPFSGGGSGPPPPPPPSAAVPAQFAI